MSVKAPGYGLRVTWDNLPGKPTAFPPAAHSHAWADITDKPATYPPAAHTHLWADITDRPTIPAATPLSNTIGAADTVNGTVGVATTAARGDHSHPLPAGRLQLITTATVGESALITLGLSVRRYTVAAAGVTTADRIVATLSGIPQNGSLQDVYVASAGSISVGALIPVLGVAATVSIPLAIYKVV